MAQGTEGCPAWDLRFSRGFSSTPWAPIPAEMTGGHTTSTQRVRRGIRARWLAAPCTPASSPAAPASSWRPVSSWLRHRRPGRDAPYRGRPSRSPGSRSCRTAERRSPRARPRWPRSTVAVRRSWWATGPATCGRSTSPTDRASAGWPAHTGAPDRLDPVGRPPDGRGTDDVFVGAGNAAQSRRRRLLRLRQHRGPALGPQRAATRTGSTGCRRRWRSALIGGATRWWRRRSARTSTPSTPATARVLPGLAVLHRGQRLHHTRHSPTSTATVRPRSSRAVTPPPGSPTTRPTRPAATCGCSVRAAT